MRKSGLKQKVVDIRGLGLEITAQLKPVMNMMPAILFWKDLDGVYCGFNMAGMEKLGFLSEAEIIGKTDYDMPWSNLAKEILKEDQKVIKNGSCSEKIMSGIKTANGEDLTLAVITRALKSHTGEVLGIIGCSVDITHCKKK